MTDQQEHKWVVKWLVGVGVVEGREWTAECGHEDCSARLTIPEAESMLNEHPTLKRGIELLEKALQHALNNDVGWELSAKAMLDKSNRDAILAGKQESG